MQRIEEEKRVADHLLYVSLKYTRTGDVILNLISRWRAMIDLSINLLLSELKKKKLIKSIPDAPKSKVELLLKIFKKEKLIKETLEIYSFFKRIPNLKQQRENEYKKNVTLAILENNERIEINIDKLKQWQDLFERFISFVRKFKAK